MENARAGMTARRHQGPGPQGRPGDLAAMVIVGLTLLLLPLGILARGYMPPDDALRHAAFAVTHRTWPQVIIGRPEALPPPKSKINSRSVTPKAFSIKPPNFTLPAS